MVQVEFVGCDPKLKLGEYGWKPTETAFLEVWVDGKRFRIDVGTHDDGSGPRRGLHINTEMNFEIIKTAINSCSVLLPRESEEVNHG